MGFRHIKPFLNQNITFGLKTPISHVISVHTLSLALLICFIL